MLVARALPASLGAAAKCHLYLLTGPNLACNPAAISSLVHFFGAAIRREIRIGIGIGIAIAIAIEYRHRISCFPMRFRIPIPIFDGRAGIASKRKGSFQTLCPQAPRIRLRIEFLTQQQNKSVV
jgi:hypothetical protein